MKKIITITTAVILLVCFSNGSAHAGSARRHTLEGVMIGAGATILGAAIISELHRNSRPYYVEKHYQPNKKHHAAYRYDHHKTHHKKFKPHRPRGHWEIEKIWIAPVYKTKWNPGHYNRRGKWVCGRYNNFLVKKGYYQKERVWVRRH